MKTKESAMKALAKRPKLLAAIEAGKTEFHKLKTVGSVSGGFIRNLMWAGICQKDKESGIVSFIKGVKAKDFKGLSEDTPKSSSKGSRAISGVGNPSKGKKQPKTHGQMTSKKDKDKSPTHKEKRGKKGYSPSEIPEDKSTLTKKELRQAARAERKRIREEKRAIRLKNKAEKEELSKAGPVTKRAKGKLLRPIKGIPANHKIEFEYQDGFWWASDKDGRYRIAQTNIKFE